MAKFQLGQRVHCRYGSDRACTGTVMGMYAGYRYRDEDGVVNVVPPHYRVKVDAIPDWWPYPNTDVFAPAEDDLRAA